MAVDLYWDSPEQTTLICEIDAGWTWDELELALRTAAQLAEDGDVGVIIAIGEQTGFPEGALAAGGLRRGRQMLRLMETIPGPRIIAGDGLIAQLAAGWARQHPARAGLGCVPTLALARAALANGASQPAL